MVSKSVEWNEDEVWQTPKLAKRKEYPCVFLFHWYVETIGDTTMQCPACKRKAWKEVAKKVVTPHGEKEEYILLCELGHWWYDTKVEYVPATS